MEKEAVVAAVGDAVVNKVVDTDNIVEKSQGGQGVEVKKEIKLESSPVKAGEESGMDGRIGKEVEMSVKVGMDRESVRVKNESCAVDVKNEGVLGANAREKCGGEGQEPEKEVEDEEDMVDGKKEKGPEEVETADVEEENEDSQKEESEKEDSTKEHSEKEGLEKEGLETGNSKKEEENEESVLGKRTSAFDAEWEQLYKSRKVAKLIKKPNRIVDQDERSKTILGCGMFADKTWGWVYENKKEYTEWCDYVVIRERGTKTASQKGFQKYKSTMFDSEESKASFKLLEAFAQWVLDIQEDDWIMGFGQHCSEMWSDVLAMNPGYAEWCIGARDSDSASPALKMFADWSENNKSLYWDEYYDDMDPGIDPDMDIDDGWEWGCEACYDDYEHEEDDVVDDSEAEFDENENETSCEDNVEAKSEKGEEMQNPRENSDTKAEDMEVKNSQETYGEENQEEKKGVGKTVTVTKSKIDKEEIPFLKAEDERTGDAGKCSN